VGPVPGEWVAVGDISPALNTESVSLSSWIRLGYDGHPRGCGGIGRRARFRSVWAKARGGSSPLIRIDESGWTDTTVDHYAASRPYCELAVAGSTTGVSGGTEARKCRDDLGLQPRDREQDTL
jgi:hypothetical protein